MLRNESGRVGGQAGLGGAFGSATGRPLRRPGLGFLIYNISDLSVSR